MRIRSLHPQYLDTKWLLALRRETLLAKKVLEGKTKGYTNHPQLDRFKKTKNPLHAINFYLSVVRKEAQKRNYSFDKEKIDRSFSEVVINITNGQLDYERQHLMRKLEMRDPEKFRLLQKRKKKKTHTMFKTVTWDVADREKL